MTNFERNAYGMTEAQIDEQYLEPAKKFGSVDMAIAGILSDCQELLNFKSDQTDEQVRKYLNIAKYMIFKTMERE